MAPANRLQALLDLSHRLSSTLDLDEILREFSERAAELTGATAAEISSWKRDDDAIVMLVEYIARPRRDHRRRARRLSARPVPGDEAESSRPRSRRRCVSPTGRRPSRARAPDAARPADASHAAARGARRDDRAHGDHRHRRPRVRPFRHRLLPCPLRRRRDRAFETRSSTRRSRSWQRVTVSPASTTAGCSRSTSTWPWPAARRSGEELSLLVIDVDGLKRINDLGGHPPVTTRSRPLRRRSRTTTRATDVSCRLGRRRVRRHPARRPRLRGRTTSSPTAPRIGSPSSVGASTASRAASRGRREPTRARTTSIAPLTSRRTVPSRRAARARSSASSRNVTTWSRRPRSAAGGRTSGSGCVLRTSAAASRTPGVPSPLRAACSRARERMCVGRDHDPNACVRDRVASRSPRSGRAGLGGRSPRARSPVSTATSNTSSRSSAFGGRWLIRPAGGVAERTR